MSLFLDEHIAMQAIQTYLEEMKGVVLDETGRIGFNIVMFDPIRSSEGATVDTRALLPILAEHAHGDDNEGRATIALSVALQCQREKRGTEEIPSHRLRTGDPVSGGGVYYNGLVVVVIGLGDVLGTQFAKKIALEATNLSDHARRVWCENNQGAIYF